jgi:hypothetical protein
LVNIFQCMNDFITHLEVTTDILETNHGSLLNPGLYAIGNALAIDGPNDEISLF